MVRMETPCSMVIVPGGVDDEDARCHRSVSSPVFIPVMGSRHENQEAVAQLRQEAAADHKSLMQIAAAVNNEAGLRARLIEREREERGRELSQLRAELKELRGMMVSANTSSVVHNDQCPAGDTKVADLSATNAADSDKGAKCDVMLLSLQLDGMERRMVESINFSEETIALVNTHSQKLVSLEESLEDSLRISLVMDLQDGFKKLVHQTEKLTDQVERQSTRCAGHHHGHGDISAETAISDPIQSDPRQSEAINATLNVLRGELDNYVLDAMNEASSYAKCLVDSAVNLCKRVLSDLEHSAQAATDNQTSHDTFMLEVAQQIPETIRSAVTEYNQSRAIGCHPVAQEEVDDSVVVQNHSSTELLPIAESNCEDA